MRTSWSLLELPVGIAAMGLALALAYLGNPGCGTPMACFMRNGACFMVCVNPFSEALNFFVVGALVGVPSAIVTTVLALRWMRRSKEASQPGLAMPLAPLILAIPGFVLVFNDNSFVLWSIALVLAAGIMIAVHVILFPKGRTRAST